MIINDSYVLIEQTTSSFIPLESESGFVITDGNPYVLLCSPKHPLIHSVVRDFIENDLGDGYSQTISKETPFYRPDGVGGLKSSYGLNKFTLQFNREIQGSDEAADFLWNFFRRILNEGNKSFYIYNPTECNFIIDIDGDALYGRYLVKLEDPNQILNREYYAYRLFNYGGITLIEDKRVTSAVAIGVHVDDTISTFITDNLATPDVRTVMGEAYTWSNNERFTVMIINKPVIVASPSDTLNIQG